jgi:hypothetical protein
MPDSSILPGIAALRYGQREPANRGQTRELRRPAAFLTRQPK